MNSYGFSSGNSTRGAIGLAGSVRARNKTQALQRVRRALAELTGPCGEISLRPAAGTTGYMNIYICPDNIHISHLERDN